MGFEAMRKIILSGLSIAIVVIIIIMTLSMRYSSLQIAATERLYKLQLLSKDIIYFDEVLTMSARLNILTKTEQWRSRYEYHATLLEQAILDVIKAEPSFSQSVHDTNEVNKKLLDLELRAFSLASQGKKQSAINLLFGKQYKELKLAYTKGTHEVIKSLQKNAEYLRETHKYKSSLFNKILISASILFAFCWVFLLFYFRQRDLKMKDLAEKDPLTGMYNRLLFNNTLQNEMHRANREGRIVFLAIFDVDKFKEYNDIYGHPMGDKVLESIGSIFIQATRRANEFSFRIGGEEFALVYSTDNLKSGVNKVDDVIKNIAKQDISHEKNEPYLKVTISAGVTYMSDNKTRSLEDFYTEADQALYKAKTLGRNQFVEYLNDR